LVILQQVIEIEKRPEASRQHQRRQPIGEDFTPAVVVKQPRALVNQIAQQREPCLRQAEIFGGEGH
jgi:hypothetical protein